MLRQPWLSQQPYPQLRSPFWRLVLLAAVISPLALALLIARWQVPFPLPPCLFQRVFGFPAPSCGLTRAFLALAQGDWQTALTYHLFAPTLALILASLAGLVTLELLSGRSLVRFYARLWQSQLTLAFIGLFMVYYGLRLWVRYAPPTLPWGWGDMAMWQQFVAGSMAL